MNKCKKALNTIGDTLTYYMVRKDLASLPSDNEIFDSIDTLRELVDKVDSFEWIPFTFDEEGILNCELPDVDEDILVWDMDGTFDKENVWVDTWESPDVGVYELER
ncbi:MAG: hypothetical protein UDK37_04570 [Holdemanella biformis]|nr:hypothetical protein [Holdemanella biformis]MEE0473149.1 hypothetical protein [Holdemanella biformis]